VERPYDKGVQATPAKLGWWRRNERRLVPYLFISPFYVLFVAFLLGPTVFAFWLSLHSWTGIGSMEWAGLSNYSRIFTDESFLNATINTLWYAAASLFIVCPLALVLAMALNSRGVVARDMFRTAYFIPIVLSPVIIAIMFTIIFDKQYGLLNAVLRGALGFKPIAWLETPGWAKVAIIIVIVWRWFGYIMIFFLAGLQNIPRDLYDAAKVDGANGRQRFLNITLPMLRPVTAFVSVIVLIGAAQIFEEPYILTRGGPGESTLSVANFIYREGLEKLDMGYAAAAGVVLFVVVFLLTQLQFRRFGIGREDEG
jgi:multiple sugar transport system permease protein